MSAQGTITSENSSGSGFSGYGWSENQINQNGSPKWVWALIAIVILFLVLLAFHCRGRELLAKGTAEEEASEAIEDKNEGSDKNEGGENGEVNDKDEISESDGISEMDETSESTERAIKEKLNDMSAMRKAKAEAKEEEKAEKELAKTRVEVAHEVRLAREAEAAMDLHVNKAVEKVAKHEANVNYTDNDTTGELYGHGSHDASAHHRGISPSDDEVHGGRVGPNMGAGYPTNTTGGPPSAGLF